MRKIKNWWKNLERVGGLIVIRNKVLPIQGYKAMFFMGLIFARPHAKIDKLTAQHEKIHAKQLIETMPFGLLLLLINWRFIFLVPFTFYILYVFEWIVRVILRQKDAYYNISFEKDAYIWQGLPKERTKYYFIKKII